MPSEICAINVLVEPEEQMGTFVQRANQRLRALDPSGFAIDETRVPHVSLLHRYVRTQNLPAIYDAVEQVMQDREPQSWEMRATGYQTSKWQDLTILLIAVEAPTELKQVQAELIRTLSPYVLERGDESAFVRTADSPHIGLATIEHVASFVPDSTGARFSPHFTVGIASEQAARKVQAEAFEPLSFRATGVAVYQLGNVGTARKLLHEVANK